MIASLHELSPLIPEVRNHIDVFLRQESFLVGVHIVEVRLRLIEGLRSRPEKVMTKASEDNHVLNFELII